MKYYSNVAFQFYLQWLHLGSHCCYATWMVLAHPIRLVKASSSWPAPSCWTGWTWASVGHGFARLVGFIVVGWFQNAGNCWRIGSSNNCLCCCFCACGRRARFLWLPIRGCLRSRGACSPCVSMRCAPQHLAQSRARAVSLLCRHPPFYGRLYSLS